LLKLDVVSPSGQFIAGREIASLIIPSSEGEINILSGHADIICLLGKGAMTVDGKDKYVIYGGIMEVSNGDSITVAADRVKSVAEINSNQLNNDLRETQRKLTEDSLNDADYSSTISTYEDILAEMSVSK
jgi:F-type H+-transporting ATPase subunit epsilon